MAVHSWRRSSLSTVLLGALLACSPGDPEGRQTAPVKVDCDDAAGSVTLCAVQDQFSPLHEQAGLGAEITFPNPLLVMQEPFVIAETPSGSIKAFFVAEGQGGAYRGVMVRGAAAQLDPLQLTPGTLINMQARIDEVNSLSGLASETQLVFVGGSTVGTQDLPPPAVVDVQSFRVGYTGEPYEGVLVRVENVQDILFDDGALSKAGAFRLEGNLHVGSQWVRYPAGVGETFSSITGFVRYDENDRWVLLPRTAADVVPSGNPRTPTPVHVSDIQDHSRGLHLCVAPDECPPLALIKMVVTGNVRTADKDKNGKAILYSTFVQDPEELDENNEPLPHSGVRVVFPGKDVLGDNTSYAMPTYGAGALPDNMYPMEWPQMGDILELEASPQDYFGNTQVKVTRMMKVGQVNDLTPVIPRIPKAKVLTGEETLAGVSGGTPAVVGCETLPGIAPGADVTVWEGVLLELRDVEDVMACVPTSTNNTTPPACLLEDFGYFKVTGNVEMGTGFGVFYAGKCNTRPCTCDGANGTNRVSSDNRKLGERFTSITGVLDLSFGVYRVNPRRNEDLVRAPVSTP